jgi:hypothetical protein
MPISKKKSTTRKKAAARKPAAKPMRKTAARAAKSAPGGVAPTPRRPALEPGGVYSVHPSVAMVTKWVEDLPAKTGRSLDEWTRLIRTRGPKDEPAAREWLKAEHALGTNTAWWLAGEAFGTGDEDWDPEAYLVTAERYVADMYGGPKAALLPTYGALLKLGLALKGVKACPCKTMVPLFRAHVIAQIKPATRTRIDFGLALGPHVKAGGRVPSRLIDTGGLAKKDRITHRFEIAALEQIDGEVEKWLRRAYELDA